MNKLILSFFLLFIFCSEAPKIEGEGNRIVVCELFTFARCPYCPYAYYALDSLKKEFKDSIIIIAYHRNILGDTLSPRVVEKRREFYYEGGGEPVLFFNGRGPVRTENPYENYLIYKNEIQRQRGKKSKLLMKIENINDSLKISLVAIDTFLNRDIRLLSLIIEDSIYFKQAGAKDSIYHCVFRGFIHNEEGIKLNLDYLDTLVIPIKMPNLREKQYLIFFVQDFNSKEIFTGITFRRIFSPRLEFYCLSDTVANISVDSLAVFKFYLRNTSQVMDVYEIKGVPYLSPNNWFGTLCVKGRCIEIPNPLYDTLLPMALDTSITLSVYPNNQAGQGRFCLKVKSLADTTIRDSQFVYIFATVKR